MKKQIRFRGFVAFLLALSLAFMGSVSAFADDPVTADLGNIAYLEITTGDNDGEIHYDDGQEDNIPSGSTITAGTVDCGILFGKTEWDDDYWQYVCTEDFTGQVTVQVGDVGSEGDECDDSAVWMNVSGENSTVNLETGSLYSGYMGLLVDNADASVEVKTKDIAVSGESSYCTYGVYLGDSNAADTLFGSFGEFDAYTGNAKTTVSVDGDIAVSEKDLVISVHHVQICASTNLVLGEGIFDFVPDFHAVVQCDVVCPDIDELCAIVIQIDTSDMLAFFEEFVFGHSVIEGLSFDGFVIH